MYSSSKSSLSYANVVKGSSSDSQLFPILASSFQCCSETEAVNIALEESTGVCINVTLLINTELDFLIKISILLSLFFFLFTIGKSHL